MINKIDSYEKRKNLTDIIESKISVIFPKEQIEVLPFGMGSITKNNSAIETFLKTQNANNSLSAKIIKFAPDFIFLRKTEFQEIFFVDIKHSITPLCFNKRLKDIQDSYPNLNINRSNVGVVAKEAFFAYRELYPNTIIIMAASYNPKLIMAQFVKDIECLFIDPRVRNHLSNGSQTPHVNIFLDSFKPIHIFFREINIDVNINSLKEIGDTLRQEGIQSSKSLYSEDESIIRKELRDLGCYWL